MAEDLSSLISDLRTAIEALSPVTESSRAYRVMEDFSMADWTDIPASLSHRAVLIDLLSAKPISHVATARTIWELSFALTVVHQWRERKRLNDTVVRGQDALQLTEFLRNRRPGEASGARGWVAAEASPGTAVDQRIPTTINATVTAAFTAVVT